MVMKILVLGSDGQIGSDLVPYLRSKNHAVVEFDIFSNKKNDLRIPNILDNILYDIDFVFFLAFDVGGSTYLKKYQNTYEFISNNVKIMNNTFDSLKLTGTPFIFMSSQMSNMTYSTYGVLKKIGEDYTRALETGKVVTLWNVYGYERDPEKTHVITDFILMAKNNGVIKMRTNGKETRQFLYAEDCSECLELLLTEFNMMTEFKIDLTNFKWESIIDIANIISSEFNGCPVMPGKKVDDLQLNVMNPPSEYILNYWKPKTNTKEGIKKIIKKMGLYG